MHSASLVGAPYEIIVDVRGYTGQRVNIGRKHVCRFCGSIEPTAFRKTAHAFPESLGNKWVFALDECDTCNEMFSVYEDALAKAVSPFLTVGGTKGKGGRVRQTGRSQGTSVLAHHEADGQRKISFSSSDPNSHVRLDRRTGQMQAELPIAGVPFSPRLAYKALAKIGLGLMPEDELPKFKQLLGWLQRGRDEDVIPQLDVGLSFASIGNAPTLAMGVLFRRTSADPVYPYMILLLCAGSVCLQIALKSDEMDGVWPPSGQARPALEYAFVVEETRVGYGVPVHFNWSATESTPQPIQKLTLAFDSNTAQGTFTPVFR
jgi:hypothetical protein